MDSGYSHPSLTPNRSATSVSPSRNSHDSSPTSVPSAPSKSVSPPLLLPPRLSSESANKPSSSKWQDATSNVERRETVSTLSHDPASYMENFDDNVLRALCDLDVCHASHDIEATIDRAQLSVWCAFTTRSDKAEYGFLPSKCFNL